MDTGIYNQCTTWLTFRTWIVLTVVKICSGITCADGGPTTFAKISSAVPKLNSQPILLYATTRGSAITAECYHRCQVSDDCAGFIVDYERASCFRVLQSDTNFDEYVAAKSTNFFLKTCLQVPSNCTKKAWPIEFAVNSELVGYQQHVVPSVDDLWQCAQLCILGATRYRYGQTAPCYSAQYHHWSKTCTLSSENRRTKPEAFNPSVQDGVDYIENLCIADVGVDNAACWHEPIYNYSLAEVDLQITNVDANECKKRCENEEYFTCRGYTHKCLTDTANAVNSICYLHSDDLSSAMGPLMPSDCSTYVQRLNCIDLHVECSANSMIVRLNYKNFNGRLFVAGYSEECGISGHNQDVTTLVLPTSSDPRALNKCGVFVARSVGHRNRKLATAVIVVQRHPIIQTLGDRVIKVSCIVDDGTDRFPRLNNITLDASFGVAEPPIQTSIVNEFANVSNVSPTARLRILDVGKGGIEASETVLGEELELRVDIYPPFNVSILRAGHLVASSGDERDSLLLLDWRGCPPDPSTFPALTAQGSNTLSAIFKAFRFPSSPVLKFSLLLTLCDSVCQPTDCGNGLVSYGRRRRRRKRTVADPMKENQQKVPLQLAIIVRSPASMTQPTLDNASEIASKFSLDGHAGENLCVSWAGIVTTLLLFGVSQIILLSVGCYLFNRRKAKKNDQVSLNNDFQPRHVSWADQ